MCGTSAPGGTASLFEGRKIGLEKESLRVQDNGLIAKSDHPEKLGSALCNPYITTDYAEALLEVVTPALPSSAQALDFLLQSHRFLHQRLAQNEFVWNTSMPCVLDGAKHIRIGEYGSSHPGQMKHVYRRALGLRYGKAMQTIAGIHFNFSWPEQFWDAYATIKPGRGKPVKSEGTGGSVNVQTEGYFDTTRNLLRAGWLIPYLFGCSPAICKTFLDGRDPLPGMKIHNQSTCYEPFGTSLRMGDIGYQYDKESAATIQVDYTNLQVYLSDLYRLISQPHPAYEKLGICDDEGQYQQLNANLLQIENEYYSSVRPKQIAKTDESPLLAMHRRGIQYLELRSVDIDVFEPAGLSRPQLAFLEAMMLYAQMDDSPPLSDAELKMIDHNMTLVAHRGREPGLVLQGLDGEQTLQVRAGELLDKILGAAQVLDAGTGKSLFRDAVREQQEKVRDPDLTPSARVLREMMSEHASFYDFAKHYSLNAAESLKSLQPDPAIEERLQSAVKDSLEKQSALEASSEGSFEQYLQNYFEQLQSDELDVYQPLATST